MSCHVSSLRLCGEEIDWDGMGWVGCIVERFCELGVVGVPLLFIGDG